MSTRKLAVRIGLAFALGAPPFAVADGFFETTYDEAGSRVVAQPFGLTSRGRAPLDIVPFRLGDISADRQYVYLGEEGGWQLRPMENRYENGRWLHVDDPPGHMTRAADTTPLTAQQRAAFENSFGS